MKHRKKNAKSWDPQENNPIRNAQQRPAFNRRPPLKEDHLFRFRDGIKADLEGIEGFTEGSSYILQRWSCC
ncbi:hypothetical protein V6N13_145864 [Hibiscus sabdariffa]|uniref:Uncharacterized protein n=1 Tax=Hibiscus sabdariffa TaxID=183260 RepID=A0ABR2TRB6_9ROSI